MSIPNDETQKLTVSTDAANPAPEVPEVVRDLVLPDAANQAKADDDRSPGLDRDHAAAQTAAQTAAPQPLPTAPARDLVLPESDDPSASSDA